MKQMKQLITILVLIALIMLLKAHGSVAQDSMRRISRREAVNLALENNLNLQNSKLEVEKSEHSKQEAKNMLYPQIEGYSDFLYSYAIPRMAIPGEILGQSGSVPVEFGTTFDWSLGIRATQIIYNKSYFTSLQVADKMVGLNELNLLQQQEQIAEQVSQVYYLCQSTSHQMTQMEISLQNMDTLLLISEKQLENQLIRPVDLARIKIDKNNLQNQMDQLGMLHAHQLNLLKYLLGIPHEQPLLLVDTLQPADAIYTEFKADSRTEIQLIDQQIDLTQLDRKINNQAFLPTLSLSVNQFYQGMRDEFDFFDGGNDVFFNAGIVGLHLSVPVFDGFAKKQKRHQQQIRLMQLQNNRKNIRRFLINEYSHAWQQYENVKNNFERQKQIIQWSEDNYQVNLMGYQEQVTSLTDLLLAENGLTEARLTYFNSLLELKNAELTLEKLSGNLRQISSANLNHFN
ncbi:MAG: TolC family protein [Cyclobacteriaceae bacterium]